MDHKQQTKSLKKLFLKNKTIKKRPKTDVICKTFSSFEKQYGQTNLGQIQAQLNTEDELVKLFKTPFTKTSITPRSNFYEYINYEWINNIEREKKDKYYVQLDVFRFTQEKVYYQLIDMVKKYISENNTHKSQCVNNLYRSMLELNQASVKTHIQNVIHHIDEDIKENNVWKLLANLNKNEIIAWSSPISWTMAPNAKRADTYINTISAGQYSLYDFSIYYELGTDTPEDSHYKKQVRGKFLHYIQDMFDTCLGKEHGMKAKDVYDVEVELIGAYGCSKIANDSPEFYNVVYADEALEKYGFNWKEFSKCLGYDKPPSKFICTSLNYLTCCCDSINKNWKTPKWRTYWIYLHMKQMIRFHSKWRYMYYDFFNNFLEGQQKIFPHDIYPIFGLSVTFNKLLSDLYMDKFRDENKITYVKNMATDLKTVFERIIKRNTWLSPSTKAAALKKFRYIEFIIGEPKHLREDPLLSYEIDDAWGNMEKISAWKLKKYLELDGEHVIDIPSFDWKEFKMTGTQAYIVNCFYNAIENNIYIPMGYLQKPFIDLEERGIEYNLAHIGYALGHELSHSLDNTGSQYDFRGNKVSWWTPRDRKIFNKKVANVIKQYETFASYDNIKFDAEVGTGEDMADISGLAICVEYLRDFQDKNKDPTPIRAFSFHAFFTYIAIQGRQKVNKKAFASQLKMNPHPMEQYRVNCALARIKLFVSLYNVKKGDKMYWSDMDTIW